MGRRSGEGCGGGVGGKQTRHWPYLTHDTLQAIGTTVAVVDLQVRLSTSKELMECAYLTPPPPHTHTPLSIAARILRRNYTVFLSTRR